MWSKELKDCETPSSQISHLRKLLTDLGMKGRFSMEQAKSIKAKRDLEKEMGTYEDACACYSPLIEYYRGRPGIRAEIC